MKKIYFVLIGLFVLNLAHAQSVQDFIDKYSGQSSFNNQTGVLTIQSSGYLNFPPSQYNYYPYRPVIDNTLPSGTNRLDYEYFIWVVPTNVNEIVIKANAIVNAAFHYEHGLDIRGENRNTSIIYGTQIRDWNEAGWGCTIGTPLPNDGYWLSAVNKVAGSADSEVKNLTFLNPRVYCVSGSSYQNSGKLDVTNCNFVDKRGGHSNNSDGVDLSPDSKLKNCYFECGDDNIKVYKSGLIVENCTFNMIGNSVPFELGYGDYTDGATMNATNIYIYGTPNSFPNGDQGRWQYYPIIHGGSTSGSSTINITIDKIYANNSSASLVRMESSNQCLNGNITNANLNINSFYGGNQTSCNSLSVCNNQGNINACNNTTTYGGSSVDSYNIPSFASGFICFNDGSNSYGSVSDVINNQPNGQYNNCCSTCPDNCGHCGYDNICNLIGSNCPNNIQIPNPISGNIDYVAENWIEGKTNNIIQPNADVTYTAGNFVRLKPGFHAKSGCDFHAYIAPCSPTSPMISPSSGNDAMANDRAKESDSFHNDEENSLQQENILLNASPNPFKEETTISYELPEQGLVNISIYDYTGQRVSVLESNTLKEQGVHQIEFNAAHLPSGIYVVRLTTENQHATSKLLLTR